MVDDRRGNNAAVKESSKSGWRELAPGPIALARISGLIAGISLLLAKISGEKRDFQTKNAIFIRKTRFSREKHDFRRKNTLARRMNAIFVRKT
ncbi:MAG TPA: hypothetical protein VNN25_25570 [Thermoanaerobaculia bacterium]|nr:hypothetical protein [Thermoanaerobaculia bacterium]